MASRKLIVEILGDSKSVERAFLRSSKAAQGFTGTITSTSKAFRNAFAAAGLAVGVSAAVDQIRKAVTAASGLEEQLNKTRVVFGRSATEIEAWSKTTALAFGVSQRAALEAAGGFGQILDTAGLNEQQASNFSRQLVELAADLASFNNIDPSEALDKLRSGLVGEAEPLRRVGVLLSEARVSQEAYTSGIAETGEKLTEGQKVQARYALILKDTAKAQGDFGRTSDSLANQQRILTAQIENLRSKIGQAFLPAVTEAVQGINRWLASSENQERVQTAVARTLDVASRAASAFSAVIRAVAPVVESLVRNLGGLEKVVKLLAAAFIATKIVKYTSAITGLGTQAAGATGGVKALRLALLRLGLIGVIAIGIELIINRDQIDKTLSDFFRKHNLTFSDQLEIPVDMKSADLKAARDGLVKLGGISKDLVKELDNVIARMRLIEQEGLKILRVPGEENRPRIEPGDLGPRFDPPPHVRGLGGTNAAAKGVQAAIDAINAALARTAGAVAAAITQAKKLAAAEKAFQALQKASDLAAVAVSRVTLALDRAGATPTLRDDIAALSLIGAGLAAQEKAIRAQLAVRKDDIGLQNELVGLQGQQIANEQALAAAVKQRADNQKAAAKVKTQTAQFRALGLDASGEALTPTAKNLRARLGNISEAVKGTFLDTNKTKSLLERIRKVLSGAFGKISQETRATIKGMLDDIVGQFDDTAKGPLTKTSGLNTKKIIEGLGLDADTAAQIRSRLSGFNSAGQALATASNFAPTGAMAGAGAGMIQVQSTVVLDGAVVGMAVTRHQQKTRRRNPQQKRGPNRMSGI